MRLVVQRSGPARVRVGDEVIAAIERGLVVLVGVGADDTASDALSMADKVAHLRIFPDADGKMNLDVRQAGGEVLSVSQFTLYGDVRKGRRPNYMRAAEPKTAEALYEVFNEALRRFGVPVQTGRFGAMMQVELVNEGPVTILLDSERVF
ncbi:putative D-aminoacyl-tRNA deacylase-like protein [Alicyclobacillus cellulosilyticus]|uniref:D-aminoacyl-tRNA deacylase n=1 Tax=Alicyclobacillus cellulosilyticus TaxID=1003997 RepID=A0A917K9N7_9BACL|nr:D-aminoacyl-tRNA deacylase [Alicyclobacillus cellulosilyticus]GGJ06021.1 putative D-aminoacyl-tRNA deacylase-like protein [Alicyclobacillus cellulosilyticus]